MKWLPTIAIVFVIFLVGCSNQINNITGPETNSNSSNNSQFAKYSSPLITVTQMIDGAVGGYIKLSSDYVDAHNRLMKVDVALFFPQGAFEGTENISLTADFRNASVSFDPHMQFDKLVSLYVEYQGLPLAEMGYTSNCKIDFVYFGDDGNIYPIGSKGVSMQYNQGKLKVTNSWLQHFSRYGFVRKCD